MNHQDTHEDVEVKEHTNRNINTKREREKERSSMSADLSAVAASKTPREGKEEDKRSPYARGVDRALGVDVTLSWTEVQTLLLALKDRQEEQEGEIRQLKQQTRDMGELIQRQQLEIAELRRALSQNVLRNGDSAAIFEADTLQRCHKATVTAILFFDDKLLATASTDKSIIVWEKGKESEYTRIATLRGHASGISCLAKSGDLLASGSGDSTIKLWDIMGSMSCGGTIEEHTAAVTDVLQHDGLLASVSADGFLKVYDPLVGYDCIHSMDGQEGKAFCVCMCASVNLVATGHQSGAVKIWDPKSEWLCQRTLHSVRPGPLCNLTSWRGLLCAADRRCFVVLDPKNSWNQLAQSSERAHSKEITSIISTDQTDASEEDSDRIYLLATSSADGTTKFWDVHAMMESAKFSGSSTRYRHPPTASVTPPDFEPSAPKRVCSSVFSPDARLMLTGDSSGSVHIYAGFSSLFSAIDMPHHE